MVKAELVSRTVEDAQIHVEMAGRPIVLGDQLDAIGGDRSSDGDDEFVLLGPRRTKLEHDRKRGSLRRDAERRLQRALELLVRRLTRVTGPIREEVMIPPLQLHLNAMVLLILGPAESVAERIEISGRLVEGLQ